MTKREELEKGTLAKVAEDEPLFVLRAKDAAAVHAIQCWIEAAQDLGAPPKKLAEAEGLIAKMKAWQEEHGTKTPD